MLLHLLPAPPLQPFVAGYWFVEDLPGEHEGRPIRTSAHPGAVLTFNFGRPNAMVGGPLVPHASLLGVQTTARGWRSWSETYFVMAMLTVRGVARLFPGTGEGATDRLVDLGALAGDRVSRTAHEDLCAAWEPDAVRMQLDRWFLARIDRVASPPELGRLAHAHARLRAGDSVHAAATAAGVSRRQLSRWCREHLGIGPKRLMDLERLQASVRALQLRRADPLAGYADQAHQIRTWRRRLGLTPGAYARVAPSRMAAHFVASGADAPAFYL